MMCTKVSKHEQIRSTSIRWIRLKNMCAIQIPLKFRNKELVSILNYYRINQSMSDSPKKKMEIKSKYSICIKSKYDIEPVPHFVHFIIWKINFDRQKCNWNGRWCSSVESYRTQSTRPYKHEPLKSITTQTLLVRKFQSVHWCNPWAIH